MNKKGIKIAAVIVIVLGVIFVIYKYMSYKEYVPSNDEIALHIQLDTKEDIGLIVYDYEIGNQKYSAGIANADRSLIKHDSDNIVVWNKNELNNISDPFELSMKLRIITEYVPPNFENVYPDNITKHIDPISLKLEFGKSYFITITGDNINGYRAILK